MFSLISFDSLCENRVYDFLYDYGYINMFCNDRNLLRFYEKLVYFFSFEKVVIVSYKKYLLFVFSILFGLWNVRVILEWVLGFLNLMVMLKVVWYCKVV